MLSIIDLGTVYLHPVTAAVSASKPEHAQPWTAGAGDVHDDASVVSNQIGPCMSECIGRSLSSSCNALMSSAWSAVHTTKMVQGSNSAPALGRIAVISYDNPLFSADCYPGS